MRISKSTFLFEFRIILVRFQNLSELKEMVNLKASKKSLQILFLTFLNLFIPLSLSCFISVSALVSLSLSFFSLYFFVFNLNSICLNYVLYLSPVLYFSLSPSLFSPLSLYLCCFLFYASLVTTFSV